MQHLSQMKVEGKDYHTGCGVVTGFANLLSLCPEGMSEYPPTAGGAFLFYDKEIAKLRGASNAFLQGTKRVFPGDIMKARGYKMEKFRSKLARISAHKLGENVNISPRRLQEALRDGRRITLVALSRGSYHAINLLQLKENPRTHKWTATISDPQLPHPTSHRFDSTQDNPFRNKRDIDGVNAYWYSGKEGERPLYPPVYSKEEIKGLGAGREVQNEFKKIERLFNS